MQIGTWIRWCWRITIEQYLSLLHPEITIVIISNWRFEIQKQELAGRLLEYDGVSRIVSDVQVLEDFKRKQAALKDYIEQKRLPTKSFLILDDEDMGDELAHAQIRTRYEDGIWDTYGLLNTVTEFLSR